MLASFDTFFESKITDFDYERASLIIKRINKLFSFWKEKNPDFEIPVIQSTALGVDPNGKFLEQSEQAKYNEYIKNSKFPSFNTKYSEEDLNVDLIDERLDQYIKNKNIGEETRKVR